MRISDWSSDVCSSDLHRRAFLDQHRVGQASPGHLVDPDLQHLGPARQTHFDSDSAFTAAEATIDRQLLHQIGIRHAQIGVGMRERSEEHTSELQSLMRISYAVFCLKKKKKTTTTYTQ